MDEMKKEELESWSLITGDEKDIRYTGEVDQANSFNYWDFEQDRLVSGYQCRAQGKDEDIEVGFQKYMLPDGVGRYLMTKNHDHAEPQARAFLLGYKARLERDRLHDESNVLMKVTCGLGKDLRFTGEVVLDASVFQEDPTDGEMKNVLSAKAMTEDGRDYHLIDPDSKNTYLTDEEEELLMVRAKAYIAGYMSRVRKEETIL